LPVTESLAFGKPCVISNRTSLPEAGGELARYFDPENAEDAYAAIRAMIDNPADLREWQDRIERDFRPRPWRATADAIARELGLHQS
jgi:glycosyltransferase involved in cell wall biosynthesis